LVYRIKSEAIISDSQITVFRLRSADNETDFSKLIILHLEDDQLSPSGSSWAPVSVFPGGWDEHFHSISKGQYDALQPDFKLRRLAAITNEFGIFAIALTPDSESERTQPFPEVVVTTTSSPEPVPAGEQVTHVITFTNKGITTAAEINAKEVLDPYLGYVLATPSQGVCKQKEAANIVVCHLGALPGGATATIRLVTSARTELPRDETTIKVVNTVEVVFKQTATDPVDQRGQIFTQVTTTINRSAKNSVRE